MRSSRHGRAGSGLLLGLVLAGLGLGWLVLAGATFAQGAATDGRTGAGVDEVWAYDLRAYVGAAARLGETGSLYQEATLSGPFRPGPFGLYMYSPTLGVALLPLADAALEDSAVLWYGAHILALLAAMALLPVRPAIRIWGFAIAAFSFAVLRDAALGNVSVLLLLPLVVGWRWLDRPLGSIGLAVAISVRPMVGIVLIWQLLRRRWRAVAWTIGAGLVLVALTLPFVRIDGYLDYVQVLRNLSGVTGVEHNLDLASTGLRLGIGEDEAPLLLLAGYAIGIGAIVVSLRRDRELGYIVTLGASLLLAPLLWDHYLAMLVLPAAFLAERGHPWALALPLLSWLPPDALPFAAIAATLLPFLARAPRAAGEREDVLAGAAAGGDDPPGHAPARPGTV